MWDKKIVISAHRLNSLRSLHHASINPVFCGKTIGIPNLEVCFILYMLSVFITKKYSYPALQFYHNWYTRDFLCQVLSYCGRILSRIQTPAPDRVRTVLRRSEPSSRTALTGEQPDPWKVLPLQDAMSRHRGAERDRRYELSGLTSLLSPG